MRDLWTPGWTVVTVMILAQIGVVGTAIFGFATLAVPMSAHFGVSRTEIMILPMLMQIGMAVSAPIAGILYDRFPARYVALSGLAAFILGLLGLGVADRFWQAALIFATLMVVSLNLAGPLAAQILAARWFNQNRGAALTIAMLGSPLGGFVVPLLVAALIFGRALPDVWLILALIWGILLTPVMFFGLRRTFTSEAPQTADVDGAADVPGARVVAANQADGPLFKILISRNFVIPTLSVLLLVVSVIGMQYHFVSIAHDRGYGLAQGAALLSANAVAAFVSKIGLAMVLDRFHPRLILRAAAILIAAGAGLNMIDAYPLMFAGAIVLGIGSAIPMPFLAQVLAMEFGVARIGRVLSSAYTIVQLTSVAPIVISALRDFSGSYQLPLTILLGLTVAAMCMTMLLRSRPAAA